MKRDIKLKIENGAFDVVIENGDFATESGFDSVLWVSLFTDARATDSQVIVPQNRRGWLGNLASEIPERQLGGYLWLVEQRRLTQDTLNEVIDYARKSLEHLVDDGMALKIDVEGAIVPLRGIELSIKITSKDGVTSDHYIQMWRLTGNAD